MFTSGGVFFLINNKNDENMMITNYYASFEWRMASETPREIQEPILCLTNKDKLILLNDIKKLEWSKVVKQKKIRVWTYQREIFPDEIVFFQNGYLN